MALCSYVSNGKNGHQRQWVCLHLKVAPHTCSGVSEIGYSVPRLRANNRTVAVSYALAVIGSLATDPALHHYITVGIWEGSIPPDSKFHKEIHGFRASEDLPDVARSVFRCFFQLRIPNVRKLVGLQSMI